MIVAKLVMPDGSDFPRGSRRDPTDVSIRQVLPAQYSEAGKTVLRATVRDGDNVIDLPLLSMP